MGKGKAMKESHEPLEKRVRKHFSQVGTCITSEIAEFVRLELEEAAKIAENAEEYWIATPASKHAIAKAIRERGGEAPKAKRHMHSWGCNANNCPDLKAVLPDPKP